MRRLRRGATLCSMGITGALAVAACGDGGSGPGAQPSVGVLRAGGTTTCAYVEDDGTAFCWGGNEFGQVGDGTTTDRHRPTRVIGAPQYVYPLPGSHTCATGVDALLCWGRNVSGELGTGGTDPMHTPAVVAGGLAFNDVVVGDDFTCGVASTGVLYCWGANDFGQLGTGVPGDSPTPVPVAGNPQLMALAAGGHTACGSTVTGELLCWGNGNDGELGDGRFGVTAGTPTAVAAPFQFGIVAIGANAAGQATVCATTADGSAYCWGKNSDGEIGDGTRVRKSVPTPASGLPAVWQVSPGGSHTCATAVTGAVLCWGRGGRLGTGRQEASLTPVAVSGGLVFTAIWSGRDHTCGWTQGDASQAYCWGDNSSGQLGDGTTTARLAPTLVVF